MTDAPKMIALRWEPGAAVTSGPLMDHPDYIRYVRQDMTHPIEQAADAVERELTDLRAKLAVAVARAKVLEDTAQALGAMPEGYCFCSANRIGDDSKTHEPECADLRAALNGADNVG